MAERKHGKPYIWVTWLTNLLGGNQCLWRVWFQAHHKYQKFEEEKANLVEWNREHSRLMADRVRELEEAGWNVSLEGENEFKLEGHAAIVAGKPDIIARRVAPTRETLIVDGKTGRERESDIWQVVFYLFAIPKARKELVVPDSVLTGEVQYAKGDQRITIAAADISEKQIDDISSLIKLVAADEAPRKVPSREECKRCNIGVGDCPERVTADRSLASVANW